MFYLMLTWLTEPVPSPGKSFLAPRVLRSSITKVHSLRTLFLRAA